MADGMTCARPVKTINKAQAMGSFMLCHA